MNRRANGGQEMMRRDETFVTRLEESGVRNQEDLGICLSVCLTDYERGNI